MRRIIGIATSLTIVSASILVAQPAQALTSSDIRLSALSVNEGSPVRVEVPYVYTASTCSFALNGPKNTKPVKVKVRNSTAKASMKTNGLPAGAYMVRVNCGKGGSATSTKISIVPKGSPTKATCDVTEVGFSVGARGTTTYGVKVTNRSPALATTDIQLAVAFLDANGNTLATDSPGVIDIPANESVYFGSDVTVSNVAKVRVDAICESSSESVGTLLRGQAQSITQRDSDYYPTGLSGFIPNPLNFAIEGYTSIYYVTRNAAGAITGGGRSDLRGFIPAGATGTWSTSGVMYPQNVASADWTMTVREA